jgi:spore coat protein H
MSRRSAYALRCQCAAILALGLVLLGPTPLALAASSKEKNLAQADALFTNLTLLPLSLEIPDAGMASLRRAPREYVRATLREGNVVFSNVAVHLKGGAGSFRRIDDRPGLTLDFNRYDPEGRFHGLKKLHLNNSVQDPTCLSELIGGQLFREAGVPAARVAHAVLDLNGRPLGLYVVVEAMDSYFLSRCFKNNNGNLYGQTRNCDVTTAIERMEGDTPLTYDDLKGVAAAVQVADPRRRVEQLERTLDVERFLSFMALEMILIHHDGYTLNRHNFRIYQDLDQGRMVFIPHDLDQLMKRPSLGLLAPGRGGMVAQAVTSTPELQARYRERVSLLATNLFVVPRLTNRVDAAVAALSPAIARHDPALAATFRYTAAEFKARIANRGLLLRRQLDILTGNVAPLAFRQDTARLTDWQAEGHPVRVRLERTRTEPRSGALRIKLQSTNVLCLGAWRTRVVLEPGWYRFEASVRCAGVDSARRGRGVGVGLVAPGLRRPESARLFGDCPGQKLEVEFEVTARDEVELGCELLADQGEAWFAEDTLQLVRLPRGASGFLAPLINAVGRANARRLR